MGGGRFPAALPEPPEEGEDRSGSPLPAEATVMLLVVLLPGVLGAAEEDSGGGTCFFGPVGRLILKWQATSRFLQARHGAMPSHCIS